MLTLLDGLESPHDDERVDIERDPDKPDASANSGDSEAGTSHTKCISR
jgi:hypothetical protein